MAYKTLTAAILLVTSSSVSASIAIDQSVLAVVQPGYQINGSGLFYQPSFAVGRLGQMQSVTAGLSGKLTKVDLQLFGSPGNSSLPFNVSLVDGEPGTTENIVTVATLNFTKGDVPSFSESNSGKLFTVDFSPFNFRVTKGKRFSLLVSLPDMQTGPTSPTINGPSWVFGTVATDSGALGMSLDYADGFNTLIDSNGSRLVSGTDRGFRTYVDVGTSAVPESGTWTMLLCGFGLAGAGMRRRRSAAISA
jgi:hypothetical protein